MWPLRISELYVLFVDKQPNSSLVVFSDNDSKKLLIVCKHQAVKCMYLLETWVLLLWDHFCQNSTAMHSTIIRIVCFYLPILGIVYIHISQLPQRYKTSSLIKSYWVKLSPFCLKNNIKESHGHLNCLAYHKVASIYAY